MKVVCHCCEPDAGLTPLDVQNRLQLQDLRRDLEDVIEIAAFERDSGIFN